MTLLKSIKLTIKFEFYFIFQTKEIALVFGPANHVDRFFCWFPIILIIVHVFFIRAFYIRIEWV